MFISRFFRCAGLLVMGLVFACPTLAHEFWIEPVTFRPGAEEPIVANLKVGQHMKGDIFPYLPDWFVEFSITGPEKTRPVESPLGAIPAVNQPSPGVGLHVLAYHSRPSRVTYDSFEKFKQFVNDEKLTGIIEAHRKRRLPEIGFTEAFTRSVKALVQVGGGGGEDSALGLPLELVAQTNPYLAETGEALVVTLLWQGKALADTQIKVFRKTAQGEVVEKRVMTDAEGQATIALDKAGIFMLSAAHMIVPSKQVIRETGALWHSFWASLTFEST